jgi:hypothetical protein
VASCNHQQKNEITVPAPRVPSRKQYIKAKSRSIDHFTCIKPSTLTAHIKIKLSEVAKGLWEKSLECR